MSSDPSAREIVPEPAPSVTDAPRPEGACIASEDWLRGVSALREGRVADAIVDACNAVETWDEFLEGWLLLATARLNQGDQVESLGASARALELAEHYHVEALDVYALALIRAEQFADAVDVYTDLLALDNARPIAYWFRGRCHVTLNDYASARADFVRAIELSPELEEWLDSEPALRAVYEGRAPDAPALD